MLRLLKAIKYFVIRCLDVVFLGHFETKPDQQNLLPELPPKRGQGMNRNGDSGARVVNTIENSLRGKNEDYRLSKIHAWLSFAFSAFTVLAGLATVIGGIWFFYLGKSPNLTMTTLSSIVGALLEFAGGAGFHLYKNSMRQLNQFHEELVQLQYLMLAIRLSEQLESSSAQSASRQHLITWILKNIRNKTPRGNRFQ